MLEMPYKTDVYIGVLLSDPPIRPEIQNSGSEKAELATQAAQYSTGKKLKILESAPINPCLVSKVAQFHAEFSSNIKHF